MNPPPPFAITHPLPLDSPYACTPKHNRGPNQDSSWEGVTEEPDAEEKTDKFAHVECDGDAEGGSSRTEQIDATDADILCKCIRNKIQNLAGYGGDTGGDE